MIYPTQDPKYGIKDNRLCVMATGEFIPEDEPVFMIRAQDNHGEFAINNYGMMCEKQEHAEIVYSRADEFKKFKEQYPERMKEPDTEPPPNNL